MTFACDAKTEYRIGTDRLCVVFVYKKANAAKALPFQLVHPESHHDPSEPPVLLIRQNGQPCQLPHGRRCVIPAEEKLMLLIFVSGRRGHFAPGPTRSSRSTDSLHPRGSSRAPAVPDRGTGFRLCPPPTPLRSHTPSMHPDHASCGKAEDVPYTIRTVRIFSVCSPPHTSRAAPPSTGMGFPAPIRFFDIFFPSRGISDPDHLRGAGAVRQSRSDRFGAALQPPLPLYRNHGPGAFFCIMRARLH